MAMHDKTITTSGATLFFTALMAVCIAVGIAVPGQAWAEEFQAASAQGVSTQAKVINVVDFGNASTTIQDGAVPLLTAESAYADGYELYDEWWESEDGSELHQNPVENAKAESHIEKAVLGDIYYYSLTFRALDGNTFAEDVVLTESNEPIVDDDVVPDVSEDGKTVTFYCFREVVCGQASALDFTGAKLTWTSKAYTGKVLAPSVTGVKLDGRAAKLGDEYQIRYSTGKSLVSKPVSRNVGYYMLEVAGENGISGNQWFMYQIDPKATALKNLKAGKKQFTVTWKKQAAETTGYKIQYSTTKNFAKKTTKTVTVKSPKTTSKKIAKLKAKKTYYVRICTYNKVESAELASKWSAAKTVTTK